EKEIWKEVLYWLASEPESVHGQMPAFMRSLTAKQATELPVDSSDGSSDYAGNVWHFIEYGRFPDGISRISMAGFTAELKTEFDTAPLLSASRLREIFRRRPWALSRLVRLADEKLLCLIASLLSGIPEAELNRYVSSWRVTGSLEKELWTEVLERIRSEYSSATVRKKDLFAAALSADSAALQPNEMASLVNPDEAAWIYLETGIQPRTTGGKMAHSVFLMKYAERQPLLFLARLREIENISSGVVGRLIHLYRPKELFRLISVLSGTAKRNIEAWLKGFAGSDPESLLSKEQIGEILEWLMIQPSSQSVKLREILSAAVPGVSRESMKSADNREPSTEEQVWYYLESGALLPGSGIQTGIRSGDLILRMASRKPVYVLSRLQEMINRHPVVFIRMLGNYKTEVLVRLIRLLAGTRLQALDDIGTKDELLLNGILESAFRWLWNNKISERKNLEDALQDIIGGHIPEKVAGQPQGLSAEDLVWYYLEYGLIPESATGVSVAYLLEVFLKLASEYPALVLARLGEILDRKPWILFRLSLQCTPEYLSRLVAALSGMKGALFDISDRMIHPEMTPQDVWIGFLRWLVDNQFADKERAPEQYLDFISIQEGSESPSMDELVWYYLRYWRLPGRLDGRVVHETELLDRLLDMFDFAPFHTRARMRELALLNTGFLTNLVTRLSDRQRNDLVSRLSGLTTDELSEMTLSVSAAGALRLPVREFWRGVLQWLIFEKLPDDRFRVYLNELVNPLKKPVKIAVFSAEASLWNYIESGNLYDFTPDRVRLLLQLAAAYPEQTLFRLAYLTSVRPVLLSSLVLRLNETDLLNLMVVLTGARPVLLEGYKNSFQTRGIPVRPVLEEILRWLLVSFSGDKKRPDQILHEILIREQPGDSDQEYTLENMFWYLLEYGSLPEKSGIVVSDITVEAQLLTISVRTPLLVLSRLKEISRRSTDNFIRFFVRQNSGYLIQTVSALSGIERRELNVFPAAVSGMTWPESLLKSFWFRALRWLVDKPLTQRSGILDFLQNKLDFLLPPVEQQEVLPAPRFSADENIWFFLLTGNSPEGTSPPAADEINRIINKELRETPARIFSKMTEFQRADRHFASRFTEKLSLATLHDTAIILFGCTEESLREIQKTLLSDTSLKRTWVEALRWIVSDFIVRTATGGSRGPLAIKGPELSDYTRLWFYLEFGRFPMYQKLSGKKSPGLLIRKALEDNFLETRNQLREIYQSRTGLVSDINSIFTENDLLLLVTGLLQISVAVWEKGVPAGSGEERYRLSWALRLILAGVADQPDQIMELTRLSEFAYKPDTLAEKYHDPEDQLWYFLEFGILREQTSRVGRSEMARLLISALAQRRKEVSGRLLKLAQVNRELPLLLSTMFSLQHFWEFLGVWFNSDPDDWQKKWAGKDYLPEYSLQIAGSLLRGRFSRREDVLRWIEEQQSSLYGLPTDVSSIWYFLESGYLPEKEFRLSGRDAVEILISSATPEDLLLQLRRLYHRNSSALLRLLQLTEQSGGDMLVLYLSGTNYSQRKELDVLFDAYGRDDSTVNHIMNLALKLLVTRGFQGEKALTEWILSEIGTEKRTTDTAGSQTIPAIANQVWRYLETGQFRGYIPELTEQNVQQYFLDGFFRHKDDMVARLRELFRTRPGLVVRLVSVLDTEGLRMVLAAILGLDLAAWKVLEDHLVSELRVAPEDLLLTGIRYILKSGSISGEELLSGIFYESGLLSGERVEYRKQPVELFWYYLEFGHYPAGEKSLATKQGNLILEQGINSPDGEFIRRLTAVFKKDSTMLLRLSVISSSELRRRLLLAVMKTDNGTLKQLEKKIWSDSSGKISREEVVTELLRLALSRKALVSDDLIAVSATESGVPASSLPGKSVKSVPDRNQAYLLWYYLEQGQYPPGEEALKGNEAAVLLMNQLSEDAGVVIIRLRELFRYHPALLAHLSGILNITLLRRLVARIINIEESVWIGHEDIIRSVTVTPHNPFRFQTVALSYVLSGSAENLKSLVTLMLNQTGIEEPEILMPTDISSALKSESTSDKEVLSEIFYESGRPAGERAEQRKQPVELFWYYLEFGYYPAGEKSLATKQGNLILEQGINSPDGEFIRRLTAVFKKDSTMLLRLSV
ncbi:MAG: Contractile injection system tape measure protein, partial [Bacteroidota bacterium]